LYVYFILFIYILGKIEEFNKKAGDSFNKLNQSQIDSLGKLCDVNISPEMENINILISLLDWPKGK